MTKKERTIKVLIDVQAQFQASLDEVDVDEDCKGAEEDNTEVVNALDIAIKALSAESCEDCISRQAVREFVESIQKIKDNHNENGTPINYGTICDLVISGWRLMRLPSVTPKPKTGHWIYQKGYVPYKWKCNQCSADFKIDFNYCPNCGAKMESEDEE